MEVSISAFIFVLLLQIWCCLACLEEERLALFQIHTSFNMSDDFFNEEGIAWGKSENCCDWMGIECHPHTGRVSKLELRDARDGDFSRDWKLNASLFLPFKQLTYLDLSANGITGCLQNEGFERLQVLNNLEYLDLHYNNFSNNILSSLSGLLSLKYLNISDNKLKGSIYIEDFNNLKNLKELYMYYNEIEELISLKGDILRLHNLHTFDLSGNRFNNNILSSLEGLSNLKNLYLEHNQFSGSFNVTRLAGLKNLEMLDLSGNNNTSEFVASRDFRIPTNLKVLYLNDMSINETTLLLKSVVVHFPYLNTLFLGGNNFNKSTFNYGSESLKNLENLNLDGSTVDENFLHSLHALSSLKSLSYREGNGLENLQGLCCNLNLLQFLDLSYNYFTGELPQCLGNLTSLQHLDLTLNNFNGGLPPCLANLTSLQFVDLSYNSIVGDLSSSPLTQMVSIQHFNLEYNNFQIPISLLPFYNYSNLYDLNIVGNEIYEKEELHNLIPKFQLKTLSMDGDGCGGVFPKFLYHQHNLEIVYLSNNKIRGEFPQWLLENNTRLQSLFISNNLLEGPIIMPSHFLVNLSELYISNNFFSGQIPTKIGSSFPNLGSLYMSNNQFNGSIPTSIGNLSGLRQLDLANNQLSGELPNSIGNLSGLLELDLANNRFVGNISINLSHCTELVVLDFNNNHLSGEVPSWLGSMYSLQILDLSGNNLSGHIPNFWGSLSLREVYLSKNMLQGSFIHAFHTSIELKTLDLSHNYLNDNLSEWLITNFQLSFLLLSHNNLKGQISTDLCRLDQLRLIDFSNNMLSGKIPHCINSSSNLYRQHKSSLNRQQFSYRPLEFTTKSISYSYKGIILDLLSGIDLSCNNLTGEIPRELGNFRNIKVLNLSHNSLGGSIPSTFSNLQEIETLDVSHNCLEGKIPSQLIQLHSLSSFNVSYNNLSGNTPDMVRQFATFDNTSYEGNPFLCGKPLSKSCEDARSPPPLPKPSRKNEEEEEGLMDMEVFYVSFGVSYVIVLLGIAAVLYINSYWRRVWFYFIEMKMIACYYFVIDNCNRLFRL